MWICHTMWLEIGMQGTWKSKLQEDADKHTSTAACQQVCGGALLETNENESVIVVEEGRTSSNCFKYVQLGCLKESMGLLALKILARKDSQHFWIWTYISMFICQEYIRKAG